MARVNKLLNMPVTSIVKDNEVEKFLSLDKTLDINSVDELQVYEELYSDIYEGIKSQLYDLSKIEQLIVQLRCQKVIMKEIHIFVSQVYVYARATFYRDDKDIKDIRVLIGPVSVLGTDMDVLLNNSMFMEDAYCKLFTAMNNEIENNLPAVEVLQEKIWIPEE